MKHLELAKIGENKGAPRIWIQGKKAANGGFTPGTPYKVSVDEEKALLTLEVCEGGTRIVSRKLKGDKEIPVIDLNARDTLAIFGGLKSVRVVVSQNRIHILPVASELRAKKRLERLRERMAAKQALQVGAVASGIGILDLAAHEGMALAGVETKLAWSNEIRDDCMEHMREVNPVFLPDTISLTLPMEELAFDPWAMSQLPDPDLFIGGVPCSGASVAGRVKRSLALPEDHPEVGALIVSYIAMVARTNPVACCLENVVPYASSASMSILRTSLKKLGYVVHEAILDAGDWNMLEPRKRLCMIAVTEGIEFSFDDVKRPEPETKVFGSIMEDVDPDHSTWGDISYLFAKQERDKAASKGFAMTFVDETSTKLAVLNKTLHKRQSTGCYIKHPTKELYRIPTVREHAACKGIDAQLVEGVTQTFGHESLGQSISMPPFVAVFEALGRAIRAYCAGNEAVKTPVIWGAETLVAA